jgi:hypothetical protein
MAKASILFGEERSDPRNFAHFSRELTARRRAWARRHGGRVSLDTLLQRGAGREGRRVLLLTY